MTPSPITSAHVRLAAIRLATRDDVGTIAAIHIAAWRATHKDWVEPGQAERISLGDRLALWSGVVASDLWPVLVAEIDDVLVGFVHALACRDADRDQRVTAEISALYITPEHQRRGHGTALLQQALTRLEAQRFRSVSLWVGAHNHLARRFYHPHGFENDGGTKVFPRTGWEGVRYVRSLDRVISDNRRRA